MRIVHSTRSIPFFNFPSSSAPFLRNLLSLCSNVIVSMAGTAENGFSTDAVLVVDEDAKFGFQRPEMHSSKLSGTVDAYDRHMFLSYKTHEDWPSRVEDSDSDPLPKLLSAALKARKNDIALKTRLSICEGSEETDGDILIFPEMIKCRYGYVSPTDVSALLDQHIGKGEIIEHLWRGQMGARVEGSQKVDEQKLSNGNDLNISEKAAPPQEIVSEEKENGGGCCQGANGVSCCRDENSDEKQEKMKALRGLGSLSCCGMGKWEQREFLTAAAVVGAVATVAVAYSFYKKSR